MWEAKVAIKKIWEMRGKTTCYFGVGALDKMYDISEDLKNSGVRRAIIVTDGVFRITKVGEVVESALEKSGIEYRIYDKVKPNPEVDMVDDAVSMGKELGADVVIGVGGGSPIDTAKSVAVLLEYEYKTARELYELKFTPKKAKPIIAINTTHGTGTEVDRFAVVSIPDKKYKPAIAYDVLYPLFAIDDPEVMISLPRSQTIYTSLDAVNHVTEAATTIVNSPYSILLAKETIRLVVKYLPEAISEPDNLVARYYLLYASMIAGISFDNGLLHLTHALEHPLSAVKPDLPHGLGLAMLLPAVVKTIYPVQSEVLAELYKPIVPSLKGNPEEATKIAKGIEEWIFSLGVTKKLVDIGFTEENIPELVKLALNTPSLDLLLSLSPVKATKDVIEGIYKDSLRPL